MRAVLRFLRRLLLFVICAVIAGGFVYSFTDHFSKRWRKFVIAKFEERSVHLDFARFGISLTDGLAARDVRIFRDAEHTQVLMTMDRLNLDLDYGRLMQRQFFVEGLELVRSAVSLPLDPQDPKQGTLDLTDFNARIFLMDDRLDIRRAEADLAGVHLVISGSLLLPEKTPRDGSKRKPPAVNKELMSLQLVRDQRESIQHALKWLTRFDFDKRPVVTFDISGSVEAPDELHASLQFEARGVRHESYVCQELSGTAEYHDHLLDIRRVSMRDNIGTFEASATWPIGGDEVEFRVNTTADLPQLAQSFFQSDELKEVVFYESSAPSLSLEGKWFVGGPKAGPKRPVEALGKLRCGRFTSRGEVFDGMSASFGVTPGGYYIRDAMLRHKSGTLSLQAMSQQIEGFKYRAVLKMDPHAFLPFVGNEVGRDWIQRFEFTDTSTIYVDVSGSGSDSTLMACLNKGRFDLRDFKFRGVEFESWTGDLEFFNLKQIFSNVVMVPRRGRVTADEVLVDIETKSVKLTGVKGKADPVAITGCFARVTAETLVKYRFSPETDVVLDGTIGFGSPQPTDFVVSFKSPDEPVVYPLWQRDIPIRGASGKFAIKQGHLTYTVHGRIWGGDMDATGHVSLLPTDHSFDVKLHAQEFRHPVLGKDLPLHDLRATITSGSKATPYDISAKVLGGTMVLQGEMGDENRFTGELQVNGVAFPQFAAIYAPGNASEGDITGHFQFTGQTGNWKVLNGKGVLIIVNGNLYAIPVLGPLTPLLGAVLPGQIKDYNVAREASCNFTVADGRIVTNDFEALTGAFKIVANGYADFIEDRIDFNAQARIKGLPGIVFRPVSELLEFKGEGTIAKPVWRSHYLSLSGDKPEPKSRTKPGSPADLPRAAEKPLLPFRLPGR